MVARVELRTGQAYSVLYDIWIGSHAPVPALCALLAASLALMSVGIDVRNYAFDKAGPPTQHNGGRR